MSGQTPVWIKYTQMTFKMGQGHLIILKYVKGSDILSLVEVQRWRHKTWDESDVIKFARNVNWISMHWLNSFKTSPEKYGAAC